MWTTHFKLAKRYLWNHKRYTAMNILALTLGFFCFIVLSAWIGSELNVDEQYPHVYRLLEIKKEADGQVREIGSTGSMLGREADRLFPEIEAVTQMMIMGRITVGNTPASRHYERITTIDSNFFKVFPQTFTAGTPAMVFSQANGIVLQGKQAAKYFGQKNALQQALWTSDFESVVAGVIPDFPENTHLSAELLVPERTIGSAYEWWNEFRAESWVDNDFATYFKLRPDADPGALERKITQLAKKHWDEEDFRSTFKLQAVADIHLYANEVEGGINQNKGSAFHLRLFSIIALVILLVACFNYAGLVNISFLQRSHDIGIYKTIGATRIQLVRQFLVESLLMTFSALFLAIGIIVLAHHGISIMMGRQFDWTMLSLLQIGIIVLAAIGVVGVSTAYPAWIATRVAPVLAINNLQASAKGWDVRKVATIAQFTMAIALLACAVIFYQQMRYLKTKSLGFELDGLVTIDINSDPMRSQFQATKQAFSQLPEVKSVAASSRVPGEWKLFRIANVRKQGTVQVKDHIFIGADEDFLKTFDLQLTAGLNFTGNPGDSSTVLINETAVKALGLENPLGQWLEIPSVSSGGDINALEQPIRVRVVGVVADFHFEDIRQRIQPMVIANWNNPIQNIDYYTLRLQSSDLSKTISNLRKTCEQFDSENPMELHFLDEQFKRFYEADTRRNWMLMLFSSMVILIACLGLFSLTAFAIRQRTKEIGIRKVLGASVNQIITLVAKDFMILMLIAVALALPIAWWTMRYWLEDFAYHIQIQWWMLALTALSALGVALLTVSFQTVKAALADPVNALRS